MERARRVMGAPGLTQPSLQLYLVADHVLFIPVGQPPGRVDGMNRVRTESSAERPQVSAVLSLGRAEGGVFVGVWRAGGKGRSCRVTRVVFKSC